MRLKVWSAILEVTTCMALMAWTLTGMSQAQNQPEPAMGSMDGMMPAHEMSKPAVPAGPLKIVYGDKSSEWTPATLAALPHQTVTVINSHTKASLTYSGVPLIDLLKQLGVPAKPMGPQLRLYLVAQGSDGYEAVYSLAEVIPELHNVTVIVADALEGKPLLADKGPLQLVTTGDKALARCVRNLVAIRVLTAE
ncbi:MAG: molybdopterin-dependent oxidoreductase [Terracidiphilus sp.]